jgi:hypothetical protein
MTPGTSGPDQSGMVPWGVSTVTGAAVILGAGVYGVGLLIVNLELARYGVASLNLARPEYVLAGVLWAVVTILGIGAFALFMQEELSPLWREKRYARLVLKLGFNLLLFASVMQFLLHVLSRGAVTIDDLPSLPLVGLVLNWVFILLALRAVDVLRKEKRLGWRAAWSGRSVTESPAYAVGFVALALITYSLGVYPLLAREFGGGNRTVATVFVVAEGVEWLADSGLPLAKAGRSITPVIVVLETDQFLYLIDAKEQQGRNVRWGMPWTRGLSRGAVGVEKRLVSGVVYRPDRLLPFVK